jgi:hypothetical protein
MAKIRQSIQQQEDYPVDKISPYLVRFQSDGATPLLTKQRAYASYFSMEEIPATMSQIRVGLNAAKYGQKGKAVFQQDLDRLLQLHTATEKIAKRSQEFIIDTLQALQNPKTKKLTTFVYTKEDIIVAQFPIFHKGKKIGTMQADLLKAMDPRDKKENLKYLEEYLLHVEETIEEQIRGLKKLERRFVTDARG